MGSASGSDRDPCLSQFSLSPSFHFQFSNQKWPRMIFLLQFSLTTNCFSFQNVSHRSSFYLSTLLFGGARADINSTIVWNHYFVLASLIIQRGRKTKWWPFLAWTIFFCHFLTAAAAAAATATATAAVWMNHWTDFKSHSCLVTPIQISTTHPQHIGCLLFKHEM